PRCLTSATLSMTQFTLPPSVLASVLAFTLGPPPTHGRTALSQISFRSYHRSSGRTDDGAHRNNHWRGLRALSRAQHRLPRVGHRLGAVYDGSSRRRGGETRRSRSSLPHQAAEGVRDQRAGLLRRRVWRKDHSGRGSLEPGRNLALFIRLSSLGWRLAPYGQSCPAEGRSFREHQAENVA